MSELHSFDELSKTKQLAVAIEVANFCTNNVGINRIAPVTVDEIMETQWAIVATVDKTFAGYIRFKQEFIHEKTFETYQSIRTLVVAKAYQRNGIGAELVREITDDVIITMDTPLANCNARSMKPFHLAGYVPALPEEIPYAAISKYGNQPLIFPRQDIWTDSERLNKNKFPLF